MADMSARGGPPLSNRSEHPKDIRRAVDGHEQPRAVADDLGEAALCLVPVEPRRRPTIELETLRAVDQAALERERFPALQFHRFARAENGLDDPIGRDRRIGAQP